MKRLLLIIAFISLLFTSAFSQSNKQLSTAKAYKSLSFNKQNTFNLKENRASKGFNNLSLPNFPKKNFKDNFTQTKFTNNDKSYDKMPCAVPQGYFPMKICKPDSTIKHTLLIKQL